MSVGSTSEGSGWRKKDGGLEFELAQSFYLRESTCVHNQSHNRLDDPEQLTLRFHPLRGEPVNARIWI